MLMNTNAGLSGEKIEFTSKLLTLDQMTSVNFSDYLDLSDGASLEVHQETRLFRRGPSLFSSSSSTVGAWAVTTICLQPGLRYLTFVATIGKPSHSIVAIDNILILHNTTDVECNVDEQTLSSGYFDV